MISEKLTRLAALGVVAGMALVPGVVRGQQAVPFATMTPAGTSVMWMGPALSADTVLTVWSPGISIRQRNAAGSSPTLSLVRKDGSSLPDGTYVWELRESFAGLNDRVYDPANGRDRVNAASAPERVEVKGRVQSGAFSVMDGLVVDDTPQEATANDRATKGSDS